MASTRPLVPATTWRLFASTSTAYGAQAQAKTFSLAFDRQPTMEGTSDGILCCSRRLVDEIFAFLALHLGAFATARPRLTVYLSFVGHSLGGLIARAAIGWLEKANLLSSSSASSSSSSSKEVIAQLDEWRKQGQPYNFQPVSFLSVASPHLGARRPGILHFIVRTTLSFYWLGAILHELMLEDHLPDTPFFTNFPSSPLSRSTQALVRRLGPPAQAADAGLLAELQSQFSLPDRPVPLLWLMAHTDSVFMNGLRRFPFRTLVSVARHDWQVPYCSSALSHRNPHSLPPRSPMSGRIALLTGFEECTRDQHVAVLLAAAPTASPNLLRDLPPDVRQPPTRPPDTACSSSYSPRDLLTSVDYLLHDGCYHPQMLASLDVLQWRRLDFAFAEFFAHDLLVAKPSVPGYDVSRGSVASRIVASIISGDHQQLCPPSHSRL